MSARTKARLVQAEKKRERLQSRLKTTEGAQRDKLQREIGQLSIEVAWLEMRLRCIKWGVR